MRIGSTRPMLMNPTTQAKEVAHTALGWRKNWALRVAACIRFLYDTANDADCQLRQSRMTKPAASIEQDPAVLLDWEMAMLARLLEAVARTEPYPVERAHY